MKAQDFITNNLNQFLDFDGWYGDQCVDLFNFYNRDVVGAPFLPTLSTGGAADLWTDFENGPGPAYYEKIPNTPDFVPQLGDVAIFAADVPGVTGPAGHVSIATGKGDETYFESLDQNYPTGNPCHIYRHGYPGLYGVLRPKNYLGGTEVEKFNEGDRRNINEALYGKDTGRFADAVGKDWKNAMYFGILETPEYKIDALVNSGDLPAIDNVYGPGDSKSFVGRTWKDLFYHYATRYSIPMLEENVRKLGDQAMKDGATLGALKSELAAAQATVSQLRHQLQEIPPGPVETPAGIGTANPTGDADKLSQVDSIFGPTISQPNRSVWGHIVEFFRGLFNRKG